MWKPEILWLDPRSLKPFENNAKLHSPEQIEEVAKSIEKRGWTQPIVVDKDYVIIVGHGRHSASLLRQWESVAVVMATHLSEEECALYRLADNKLNESPWDFPKLAIEFKRLKTLSTVDLTLSGFKAPEIKRILSQFSAAKQLAGNTEDVPSVPAIAKTKPGEIYQLGEHRLMCGDATNAADVAKLMGGRKADMIWTDPPYNVNYVGKTKEALTIENDKMSAEDFYKFLFTAFSNLSESVRMGGAIYICHADLEGLTFRRAMVDAGFLMKQCIIWVKQSIVMGRSDYHWQHEPILYGWREGGSHQWHGDRKQSTVWNVDRPSRSEEHPTMKPLALIEKAVTNSSVPGETVLDLFGGSGSTMIACERLDRRAYTMELDPRYCDVILHRWSMVTGNTPTLVLST